MKRPQQVLSPFVVDRDLAADRGIRHGHDGGRHGHPRHPTADGGGGKPCHVQRCAPPDGDDDIRAAKGEQGILQACELCAGLAAFTSGDHDAIFQRQGADGRVVPVRGDVLVHDKRDPTRRRHGVRDVGQARTHAMPDRCPRTPKRRLQIDDDVRGHESDVAIRLARIRWRFASNAAC